MQTTCIVSCNLPQNALEYTVIILHSFYSRIMKVGRLPRWYSGKEFACQCRRGRRFRFNPRPRRSPGVGKFGNLPNLIQLGSDGTWPRTCQELSEAFWRQSGQLNHQAKVEVAVSLYSLPQIVQEAQARESTECPLLLP